MSVKTITAAERTLGSRDERLQPLAPGLRRAELLGGTAYFLVAAALASLAGVEAFSMGVAIIYITSMAVASNVRFDVGAGFTVPTQAIFVPMLFALPVAIVPVFTALGLALGMLADVIRGRIAPSWILTAPGNSWFALGPALVLTLAHDHSPDGRLLVLACALGAQFAIDFVAAALRDRLFEDASSLRGLVSEVCPIYAIDVALSFLGLLVALATTAGYGQWPVVLIAPLFGLLWFFSQERQERLSQLVELNDAYQGTALLLGDVVESDDSYTGAHSKSVVRLALDVAEEMRLDPDSTRRVEFAALLHDIGKLAIPNEIINKPGQLSAREWEIVKTHTIEGQKMLRKIGGLMGQVGAIVRASHEAWDGSGYPDGLSGQEIPIEARIVSACDAFNAMTTTRSYRRAMPIELAITEMEACAGTQFDPDVVAALLRMVSPAEATEDRFEPVTGTSDLAAPELANVGGGRTRGGANTSR